MGTRLGIDVGGTFTDVVVMHEDGTTIVEKVASTPQDPALGVMAGIRAAREVHGVDTERLSLFSHGSTVATNALLEFKLPRTALLVTRGFRDVLEIGTQTRPQLFNLGTQKTAPVVPRSLVFEVEERLDRLGTVVTPVTDQEIERLVAVVRESEVQAVAICLLFSFHNGEHERRIATALRSEFPGLSVALSCEVAPEIKEYPRASTTAVSAALQPLVAKYIANIEMGLQRERVSCPFFVMQSNGGVVSADEASSNAHRMVLSGPAAGVLAATQLAEDTTYRNQITFDMGGTSTDICLIHEGRARLDRESLFEGRPLRVPQFDIHTIGSGGGSIARVDAAGLLRVGPESAGAHPGPACYGRGGVLPTTTDAHVVLGRIDPFRFLGGEMPLDKDAAEKAIREHIAGPLGISVEEAALGILDVADAIMARGVRVVSVNRGYDPRDFTLVPFGGAGPMHALSVGALVDAGAVVVPVNPGTFSAVGLAASQLKYDFGTMVDRDISAVTAAWLESIFENLIRRATEHLDAISGVTNRRVVRLVRFRYAWQDNDVEIVTGEDPLNEAALAASVELFHEKHAFEFGHSDPTERVEVVAVSVEVFGELGRRPHPVTQSPQARDAAASTRRLAYFRETGWVEVAVFERSDLRPGDEFSGPCIVEEREATTIVIPGFGGVVDAARNLLLRPLSKERT
jgi:N-methylhydantoinase A